MIRRRIALIFLPALLVLALTGVMAWLMQSESGARWIWSRATTLVPGSLSAGTVSGSLRRGLELNDLRYNNETVSVALDRVRLVVAVDLLKPAIAVRRLDAGLLTISRHAGPTGAQQRSLAAVIESLALPLPVNLEAVRIQSIGYRDASGAMLFAATNLDLSARWFDAFHLRGASLHLVPCTANTVTFEPCCGARTRRADEQWQASGKLELQAPFKLNLDLSAQLELEPRPADGPWRSDLQAHFTGSLDELHARLRLQSPVVELSGTIHQVLTAPRVDLQLTADAVQWPPQAEHPAIRMDGLVASLYGTWQQYGIEASTALSVNDLPALQTETLVLGDGRGARVERLRLAGDQAELVIEGSLDWQDQAVLDLSTRVVRLDPGLWIADWPAAHPLTATASLRLQGARIEIQGLDLAVAETDFSISGDGIFDLNDGQLQAELRWRDAHWPVGVAAALRTLTSEQGKLSVSGQADDWTVTGAARIQAAQWPQGELQLHGRGDRESAQLVVDEGEILGGRFAGQLDYRWSPEPVWTADIRASQLDISVLDADYPALISTQFSATGTRQPDEVSIDIRQLDGRFRNWPISGHGGLTIAAHAPIGQQISASALELRSGDSFLRLNGNMSTENGLEFAVQVDAMEHFLANAAGRLAGKGRISTHADLPLVVLDLDGQGLVWNDLKIGKVAAMVRTDPEEFQPLRLRMDDIHIGERVVQSLLLEGNGHHPWEALKVQLEMDETRLDAQLNGALRPSDTLADLSWGGHLEAFRIADQTLDYLRLEHSAGLHFARSGWHLDPACFRGPEEGRVCLAAKRQQDGAITADLEIDTLSLNLARFFVDTRLRFSQKLSGQVQWNQAADSSRQAQVHLRVSPGKITAIDEDTELETGAGAFGFNILDGQLLAGKLDLPIRDSGFINTDFGAADLSLGLASPIQGRIQVTLEHVEPLMRWFPQWDSVKGRIDADMRLSGTVLDPRLTGHASLVRGSFEHYATGLVLTDIQLAGAVFDYEYTEFNGSFKAGDGTGRIKVAIGFSDILNPEITLELKGEKLTLVDVPDLNLVADPDIEIHWLKGVVSLDGRITIPYMRLSPNYLPTSTSTESDDLVIVAGGQAKQPQSLFDRTKLRLNGQVEVILGTDVTVTLQRATARLSGSAVFQWDNALMPIADGSYSVTGKAAAYGQVLEISEGRISFPHSPADNPHLNISAEREIYGNLQVKQAGALITGTLKRPTLEPYTRPMTSRERALTMLVTGNDFDYEQGVGAVEVGMYIAPRLFVSYGVGLFDNNNVISARYDLGRGFGIKGTSGQRETGGDISYTIER